MKPGDHSPYISTARAADALGVSVSTVKRWVDDGILPAHRTAGGHRKLLRGEVEALIRQGALPGADPAGLSGGTRRGQPPDLDALAGALLAALLRGDGAEVRALVRRARAAGTPVQTLTDRVIAPAMARVGHDWERAHVDVWQEHRGTQLCAATLYDLKDQLEARTAGRRPVAVGGAPAGDPYLLATLLAQMVLLEAGWNAVNLGPDTPLASLTRAVRELRPRLVWLSVSHLPDAADFLREYAEFYRAADELGVAVAVGGRALTEPIRSAMPYTTYGDRLAHLAAFARTLHPGPKRPTRGRPPKA